jgi:putative restriction endonuclease
MRRRIAEFRRQPGRPGEDFTIGNVILQQPFFFTRDAWIPIPSDFSLNIVQGKGYDLDTGTGREIAVALDERFATQAVVSAQRNVAEGSVKRMFSDPVLARRRLGQGAFRILVTDTYERQCAVSREHTLPVLEAAHIRPVTQSGEHAVTNGLLLRSDVHRLFDLGYVTISSDLKFRVSKRLDEDWRNGKIYYAYDGQPIHVPKDPTCRPDVRMLEWHADEVFLR